MPGSRSGEVSMSPDRPVHVVTLGDVMLDVLVEAPDGLRIDDDTEARIDLAPGGQAANVAAWVVELGARATLVGPRGRTPAADFVAGRLAAAGVEVLGVETPQSGKVVAILSGGTRTLASDAGDQNWVQRLAPATAPTGADWLHVSGYPLLRAQDPTALLAFVDAVRRSGASVSLDLASAGLVTAYGPDRLVDVLRLIEPRLLFANASEWQALGLDETGDLGVDLVIKRGDEGVRVRRSGTWSAYRARTVDAVDLTGAGDALAAGYLVGGVDLALDTAARCITQRGAQPAPRTP